MFAMSGPPYPRNGITLARSRQSKKVFRCEQLEPVSVNKPGDWPRFDEDTINLLGYPILVLQGLKLQETSKGVRHFQECQAGCVESVPSLRLFEFGSSFFSAPFASVASNGSPSLQRRWQEAEGSLKIWRRWTVADTSIYLENITGMIPAEKQETYIIIHLQIPPKMEEPLPSSSQHTLHRRHHPPHRRSCCIRPPKRLWL